MFPTRRIITGGGDKFRDEHSLAFDGTDDNIRIPPIEYNVDGGTVSFVFWLKRAAVGETRVILGHTSSANEGFIRFNTSNEIKVESDAANDVATITQNTNDTGWHHYVISISSGTVTAFQDGVSCSVSGDVNGDNLTINTIGGSGTDGTDYEFNGNISEIAAYNITLSSSQAKQIYNDGEPFDHKNWSKTGNLTQWWRMGDGAYDGGHIITDEANLGIGGELSPNISCDSNVTGWSAYGSDGSGNDNTIAHETTIKNTGAGSLKSTSKGNNAWAFGSTSNVTWVANKVYLMTADIYIPDGNSATDLRPRLTDGSGLSGATAEQHIYPVSTLVDTWQPITTVFLNASDTSGDEIFAHLTADGDNDDVVYWDNISVRHLSGNAGVMLNMTLADIEGDTP